MVVSFLAGFSAGFLLLYMDWLSDFISALGRRCRQCHICVTRSICSLQSQQLRPAQVL
ncbi:hypothetical protein GALMADRAFT_258975, partial [Galerina marginata CBS 339.88]